MVPGRRETLEGERLRSNLQVGTLTLDSSKDSSLPVILWKAEYAGAETMGT